MDRINALGIDLAKNIFQLHGVDANGKAVLKKQLTRKKLTDFVSNLEPTLIGVEASSGARHWVREFKKLGHQAKLIPAQFVKPFVKSEKNDANDAEAICEAVQRPNMRFVSEKTLEQEQIQMVHRIRERRIRSRTELCNEIRGILNDSGIIAPKGLSNLRKKIDELIKSEEQQVGEWLKKEITVLKKEWVSIDENIAHSDNLIEEIFEKHEVCKRLVTIPGVGKITATALIGAVGDIHAYKSGRHLSASFGLVPRQNSSGGKQKLSGITKRGDVYIRTLLIHGGRTVVQYCEKKTDKRSLWIKEKVKTRGKNKAAVAVANKNARVIWKIMKTEDSYKMF